MLVLARRVNEKILVGDDIVITIVDIRGDKCRVGIEATRDVPVHRQEVYEAIQREAELCGTKATHTTGTAVKAD